MKQNNFQHKNQNKITEN